MNRPSKYKPCPHCGVCNYQLRIMAGYKKLCCLSCKNSREFTDEMLMKPLFVKRQLSGVMATAAYYRGSRWYCEIYD